MTSVLNTGIIGEKYMKKRMYLGNILCLFSISLGSFVKGYPEIPEELIVNTLFQKYKSSARPSSRANEPVDVDHSMDLIRIESFKDQKLVVDVWITLRWRDVRLVWNPNSFYGVKSVSVPGKMLWRPDITLYNGIGDIMKYNDNRRLLLNNNGMVLWLLPARLESICNDIALDGGQNVTCKWKFGSWTYNGLQLNITHSDNQLGMSNYFSNRELYVIDVASNINLVRYPCCPEPYPDVTYKILLRRNMFKQANL